MFNFNILTERGEIIKICEKKCNTILKLLGKDLNKKKKWFLEFFFEILEFHV